MADEPKEEDTNEKQVQSEKDAEKAREAVAEIRNYVISMFS